MDTSLHQRYSAMVGTLAKSGEAIIAELTPVKAHLWHMGSCILGELTELQECLTKALNDEVMGEVTKELGDVEFYLEGIRQHVGFDMASIEGAEDVANGDMLVINAGLLFDKIKRVAIYNKPFDDENKALIRNALTNVELEFEVVVSEFGLTRDQIRQRNMEKLSDRYGKALQYSNQAAVERKDEKEWS